MSPQSLVSVTVRRRQSWLSAVDRAVAAGVRGEGGVVTVVQTGLVKEENVVIGGSPVLRLSYQVIIDILSRDDFLSGTAGLNLGGSGGRLVTTLA